MVPFPPLTTSRLVIRPFLVEDVTQAYVEALNDPEVVRFTEVRHRAWTREAAEAYVRSCNGVGQPILLGCFLRATGQHVANVILHGNQRHQHVEMAFMLWDRSRWGQGYMTEAICALTEACFRVLGMHRVVAGYYATHKAAARVLEKAGFQVEGVFREHYVLDGAYVDGVRVAKVNPTP